MQRECVLNTRPKEQAYLLTQALKEKNIASFELPTIKIIPIKFHTKHITSYDIIIFLSANAVTHFFSNATVEEIQNKKIISIGPATKKCLIRYNISNIILPEIFSSTGILALGYFQQHKKQNILIISGKNPKPLLLETLIKQGHKIKNIQCYERLCIPYNMKNTLPKLKAENIKTIISTSLSGLQCLLTLFNNANATEWLLKKTLLVVSEEMFNFANQSGFLDVINTNNATTEAIINALKD